MRGPRRAFVQGLRPRRGSGRQGPPQLRLTLWQALVEHLWRARCWAAAVNEAEKVPALGGCLWLAEDTGKQTSREGTRQSQSAKKEMKQEREREKIPGAYFSQWPGKDSSGRRNQCKGPEAKKS